MPSGKAEVRSGVAPWNADLRLHYGVNISSLRPYVKRGRKPPAIADMRQLRAVLRRAFKIYLIARVNPSPTGTERRQTLKNIALAANKLVTAQDSRAAYYLLDALETPDLDARNLAYKQLRSAGYHFALLKRRLRHWTIHAAPDHVALAAAKELSKLDPMVTVPVKVKGSPPDPALAELVALVAPIWQAATGRTAGLTEPKNDGSKFCAFANWLAEMHDLLKFPAPTESRVVGIVRKRPVTAQD